MTVAGEVTLPDQPPAGFTAIIVLGGNGWSAPKSMYEIEFEQDSDSSGGNSVIDIVFDPQYESLLTRVEAVQDSTAGVVEYMFELNFNIAARIPAIAQGAMDRDATLTNTNHASWDPPPIMDATSIRTRLINVDDTETSFVRCWIYNFNKGASQVTPLPVLLASLPRGQNQSR